LGVHKFNIPAEVTVGDCKIEQRGLNTMLENIFNKTQYFLDNEVVRHLQNYVAVDTHTMERSISTSPETKRGEGQVAIDTIYAHYQAYSPRIKKRVGLRGTYPFERMCSDRSKTILNDVSEYSRRLF